MSRSHLLSLLLFASPAALAATGATPPPEFETIAVVAIPPIMTVLQANLAIIQLDNEGFTLREKKASPAELAAHAKVDAEKRAAAWKSIEDVKRRVSGMALTAETRHLGAPALSMTGLTRQLADINLKIFAALDSGNKLESPEIKSLLAKAEVCAKARDEQRDLLMKNLRELKAATEAERAAKKAAGTAPPNPAQVIMTEHGKVIKLLVDEIVVRNRYLGTAIPVDVQRMLDLHPAQRERSLKQIAACMERYHHLADSQNLGEITAPAIQLDKAACEVRANMEQVLALVRSGKSQDSPEALALRAKADPARKAYSEAAAIIQKRLDEIGVAPLPASK